MISGRHTLIANSGFLLQEVMFAIVVFAIAVIPIVRGLSLIPEVATAVSQESRAESWRSANEQSISCGIDPVDTAVMQDLAESPFAGVLNRTPRVARAGAPQVTLLGESFSATAEWRTPASGIEIGASTVALPVRTDPLPPLPPITLSPPVLNPASGTFVAIGSLAEGATIGAPYQTSVVATGASSADFVRLRITAPRVQSAQNAGGAAVIVDASDLAQAVHGQAWAEFAGDPTSDIAVDLGDGRTTWLVPSGDRLQAYQPSDVIAFVYGLDLGRPVYRVGTTEYPSGATVPITYFDAVQIDAGTESAQISLASDTMVRLGSAGPALNLNFSWTFAAWLGDSENGNTRSLYSPEGRARWDADQLLQATPSAQQSGVRLGVASWTLQRTPVALSAPERTDAYYDGQTDQVGTVAFSAPVVSQLHARVGRPSIDAVEAVSDTLLVPVIP